MNGAQQIIEAFRRHHIDTVFGYPGGCIMPLYDALVESDVRHVLCRHEQACALAAEGYSRASGRLGVCIATSGPGATNLVTGVADAHRDSVPLLVHHRSGTRRHDRHRRLPGNRRTGHESGHRQTQLPGADDADDIAGSPG